MLYFPHNRTALKRMTQRSTNGPSTVPVSASISPSNASHCPSFNVTSSSFHRQQIARGVNAPSHSLFKLPSSSPMNRLSSRHDTAIMYKPQAALFRT